MTSTSAGNRSRPARADPPAPWKSTTSAHATPACAAVGTSSSQASRRGASAVPAPGRAHNLPRAAGGVSSTADYLLPLAARCAGTTLAAVATAAAAAVRAGVRHRLVALGGRLVAGGDRIAHALVVPAACGGGWSED